MGWFTSKKTEAERIERELDEYCDNRQALTRLECFLEKMPDEQRNLLLELLSMPLTGTLQIGWTTVVLSDGKVIKVEN